MRYSIRRIGLECEHIYSHVDSLEHHDDEPATAGDNQYPCIHSYWRMRNMYGDMYKVTTSLL